MLIHQITESNYEQEREKGKTELDKKFYKLDRVREVVDPKEFTREFAYLLRDPTIWAYATLKDKENKPLKLLPYQDKFVNDKHRFIHITASNQIGKTYAMCVKALHHAMFVPNASVMIISKSDRQAKMVLDEIKWLLKRATIDYSEQIGEVENREELHIKGPLGSVAVIRCFPPTTSALGFPSTLTIGDEIGFWEKIGELTPTEFYDQVIEPRSNMTKSWTHAFLTMGQIIFITNPNGKRGLAWRTYSQDPRFNCYRYCWLAYPENTLEEYNLAKKRLPSYRFASIYGAEYVSAEGGFISLDQYDRFADYNVPLALPPNTMLYLGGDFSGEDIRSRNRDSNVLYGVIQVENTKSPSYPRIRVVYQKTWPSGTKKTVIYEEIWKLKNLEGISIAKFAYDKVGVGDKVKNDLIDQGILSEHQIESLTYSLPNKSDVYLNFQALFEQDMIEGRDIDALREQLLGLEVEQPEGSVHLKIHHRTEGIRDDHPDALANACFAAKRLGAVPVGLSIVGKREKTDCRHAELEHDEYGELICKSCGEQL